MSRPRAWRQHSASGSAPSNRAPCVDYITHYVIKCEPAVSRGPHPLPYCPANLLGKWPKNKLVLQRPRNTSEWPEHHWSVFVKFYYMIFHLFSTVLTVTSWPHALSIVQLHCQILQKPHEPQDSQEGLQTWSASLKNSISCPMIPMRLRVACSCGWCGCLNYLP